MIDLSNIKTIGERVLSIRIIFNLTQYELAEYLGISQYNISRIENNKALMNSDHLIKLHNIFNINIEWLLLGKGAVYSNNK